MKDCPTKTTRASGHPHRRPKRRALALGLLVSVVSILPSIGCKDDDDDDPPPSAAPASGTYRAIAGVSMGGYGAMNLGTKYPDRFGVIGSLGGPVDLLELLAHIEDDNMDVMPSPTIPMQPGDDFTFDLLPSYPDRDTRIEMMQDLMIAFGNPFLHHPDPIAIYLASDSEPAQMLQDDRFGVFTIPIDARGFLDGGDANEDGLRQMGEMPTDPTEVLLVGNGTLGSIAPGAMGVNLGGRNVADTDGDGVFDVGDGIIVNGHEPFDDVNGNGILDGPEIYQDDGLDGVPGTGDYGEANGMWDTDPDRATWVAQDPTTRLESLDAAFLETQRIYMDVGTEDAFEFEDHYLNLVSVLENRGFPVVIQDGLSGDCASLPGFGGAERVLVRYAGGHVGIPEIDSVDDVLLNEDICSDTIIWRRILALLGFLDESFPDGVYGPQGLDPLGETEIVDIETPELGVSGQPNPMQTVVVYRPPAFFNTDLELPVIYFLGGYGQTPESFERVGLLLDLLIGTGELQNVCFVVLPGQGVRKGSFYVDHVVPHDQVPDATDGTNGQYEQVLVDVLIPFIEENLLEGRVRSD